MSRSCNLPKLSFILVLFNYHGLSKPIWGLLTDTVPINGYRRRPYFIFAGLIGVIAILMPSLSQNVSLAYAKLFLMAGSAGIAIAVVTMDACVTENNISHPALVGYMQSLSGLSSSTGALAGFSISSFLVHIIGSKVSLKGVFELAVVCHHSSLAFSEVLVVFWLDDNLSIQLLWFLLDAKEGLFKNCTFAIILVAGLQSAADKFTLFFFMYLLVTLLKIRIS